MIKTAVEDFLLLPISFENLNLVPRAFSFMKVGGAGKFHKGKALGTKLRKSVEVLGKSSSTFGSRRFLYLDSDLSRSTLEPLANKALQCN